MKSSLEDDLKAFASGESAPPGPRRLSPNDRRACAADSAADMSVIAEESHGNAIAIVAIHAVIGYADALCIAYGGFKSTEGEHERAVDALKEALGSRSDAKQVSKLLRVRFTDGTERVIDVERFLRGPVFEPLKRDRSLFQAVRVDAELGTVIWPNGADIDPAVLYGTHEPAWKEQETPR